MRDRRAERRAATTAEIVDAAWELCRAEGLAGLSLRDLAKRVGMQAPSLYSYFGSKHAIYDAMFAQGMHEFAAGRPNLDAVDDPLQGVRLLMGYFVEFCTVDPVRYQLLFQRTIPGFEPSPESYAPSVEGLELTRRMLVDAGGDDPADLDLFTAITTGLTDQQISNDPGGDRWIRLIDEAVEMFYDHMTSKGKQPATRRRKK